jgi:hypothetical protein
MMITIMQSDINVKMSSLRNGDRYEKIYLHFLLQMISPTISLSVVLYLWIILYLKMYEVLRLHGDE